MLFKRISIKPLIVASEVPTIRTGLHGRFVARIRLASPLVPLKRLPVRAPAQGGQLPGYPVRDSEAQLLAPAVVIPARLRRVDALLRLTENFDSVKPIRLRLFNDRFLLLPGYLVYFDDGVQAPVGYVHEFVVNDDAERVSNQLGVDRLYVRAVQVGVLDVVQEGVAPIQAVRLEIDRKTVGPT